MITKTEAERIAAGVHAVRPDWPVEQLMTLLAELRDWPMRDLDVALHYVATDQNIDGTWTSKSPYRVKEQGPWRTIGESNAGLEAARTRAKAELAERKQAIKERSDAVRSCDLCDHEGRLENGWLCRHDVDTNTRSQVAKFYADKARAEIRPMRKLGDITKEMITEGNPA
jgi:hypothetical protein